MKKIYLSLLISHFCFAQTINFSEALKQSLGNSKDLKKQELNIQISKEDTNSITASNYGVLSLNSNISRTNHAGYVFMGKLSSREATFKDFGFSQMNEGINTTPKDLNYPGDRTAINNFVSYDLPLFTGFKLENYKDISKLQEKANEILYNLDKKNLEFEVLKAYNGAVLSKDYLKTMKNAQKNIEFIHNSALEFHKNGLVTKIDVNEAKVYMLNVNSKLVEAENNFNLSLAYLKFLTSNELISDVEGIQNIYFDFENEEELYKKALEKRDEVSLQKISIDANNKNIDIQKSSYYPQVFTHLEYGVNDNRFTSDQDKDYYMALLGISLIIFDGSRNALVEKAKLEELKSKLDYEKLKDGIKLELEKAMLNYKAKQAILKEKIEAKELANEVLNQAKLQYKNRLISMTTLINQETNYEKSQTMLLEAIYENSLALANLNLVLGKNIKTGEEK
ncbi:TolC family protein [Aliarcobacter cibarius]|uniref:RND family efflux system, outer membrane channel protein, TolC family n=1 Tax=Aliarcobacter cibarius TaxID=255507 RepID=A0A7L5JQ10_9BACT|nr:TolC family protein [Aliarcobacter cibarius]QKJ27068.1 RND family efflux system, outer membrane channel protein, TolC family [Aliarcobacter cibarius]TLS98585.1 TolC family protein [Aliarcobacter cibarius]TLS99329.1 TolC family protein [Aliarcobacter cibarius]TLT02747.1 TolC family protein [Aliarcobacter cibarius]